MEKEARVMGFDLYIAMDIYKRRQKNKRRDVLIHSELDSKEGQGFLAYFFADSFHTEDVLCI